MPERVVVLPSAVADPNPARREKLQAAARIFTEVVGSRRRFHGVTVHSFMKGMPGRIVVEATLGGRPCYFKLLVGAHAEMAIREMRSELRFAEANMAPDASLRVARVLDAAPPLGLIVLEAAPGLRMDDAVEAAGPRRRSALFRRGGEWLGWYCAPRRETRSFNAERFLAEHALRARPPAFVGELPAEDRGRIAALTAYIDQRARQLHGHRVSIAASHGDFLSRNAHVSGSVVTVYDIEGLRRLPVAGDAARFLVNQQMRQGAPAEEEGRLICGLTAADWTAFFGSGVIDADEEEAMMPLFVAQQMQIELPTTVFRPNWQRRLRRSIDSFLSQQTTTPGSLPARGVFGP